MARAELVINEGACGFALDRGPATHVFQTSPTQTIPFWLKVTVRGIPAYGFVPCLVRPDELAGVHGRNKRISIENLQIGLQILYEVVRRLVAA